MGVIGEQNYKVGIELTSDSNICIWAMRERVKEKLKENLKNKMVSLYIDEPTNNNNDKIFNVIAQHYNT